MWCFRIFTCFILVLIGVPLPSCAESNQVLVQAQIKAIKVRVSNTENEVATLNKSFNALMKEKREVEVAIQESRTEEARTQARVNEQSKAGDLLEKELDSAQQAMELARSRLIGRLKEIYKLTLTSDLSKVLWSGKASEIERIAVYAKALQASDKAAISEVKETFTNVTKKRVELEKSIQVEKALQSDLAAKRLEREQALKRVKVLSDEVAEKKSAAKQALLGFQREADNLSRLLENILQPVISDVEEDRADSDEADSAKDESTESEQIVFPTATVPELLTVTPNKVVPVEKKNIQTVRQEDLLGIFRKGAQISKPVIGALVQRFGKTKPTTFAEIVFSKGVEIAVAAQTPVLAISNAKVAFAGTMPGYEQVVVLDHGARSFSLYGRLGGIDVTTGSFVAQGEVLGKAGQSEGPEETRIYFEVRKNSTAVDPTSVVRGLGK